MVLSGSCMTIQKPSKVIYTLMVLPGRVRVNFIRGFSRPEANLYMDIPGPLRLPKTIIPSAWIFPSSFWMFQKLHIRVHGFPLRPLDFPRICMSEYMDFSQALGFSGICISEYMDFPPALGFSKNLYVRVHGFFFPTAILYIDFFGGIKPFVFQNVALQKKHV